MQPVRQIDVAVSALVLEGLCRMVVQIARWNDVWIGFVTADLNARERTAFMAALGKLVAKAKVAEPEALSG